jgi:hypothetical protein
MCALISHSLLTITLLKPVAPEPIDGTEDDQTSLASRPPPASSILSRNVLLLSLVN